MKVGISMGHSIGDPLCDTERDTGGDTSSNVGDSIAEVVCEWVYLTGHTISKLRVAIWTCLTGAYSSCSTKKRMFIAHTTCYRGNTLFSLSWITGGVSVTYQGV